MVVTDNSYGGIPVCTVLQMLLREAMEKKWTVGVNRNRKLSGGCVEMDLYSSSDSVTIINPVEEQSK